MKKPTAKQYRKIQQVAQRFISLMYEEFKNPIKGLPSLRFLIGDIDCFVGVVQEQPHGKKWVCYYYADDHKHVPVEI